MGRAVIWPPSSWHAHPDGHNERSWLHWRDRRTAGPQRCRPRHREGLAANIVKGDIGGGEYVVVSDAELANGFSPLADPAHGGSNTAAIANSGHSDALDTSSSSRRRRFYSAWAVGD